MLSWQWGDHGTSAPILVEPVFLKGGPVSREERQALELGRLGLESRCLESFIYYHQAFGFRL